MIIDVDKCKRLHIIGRKPRIYFGKVIFYFRHEQQGITKLLALVQVWEAKLSMYGIPYRREDFSPKYLVVSTGDIRSATAVYTDSSRRKYIVWPEMMPLKDNDLGLLTELY